MSEWSITRPSQASAICFCPGCGRELRFARLEPPELLKCVECEAQWLLIVNPKAKGNAALPLKTGTNR
jgi:hypothetical protein